MQIVRSKRRAAVVAAAAATGVALIVGTAALGSHRPEAGLLADATTLNEVDVKVKGLLQLKTRGPVRVWQLHLARNGVPFTSPWHTHPGPELIAVSEGTATVTRRSRRGGCASTEVPAGKAYVVPPGVSFQVKTTAVVDLTATLLLPPGGPISGPGEACVAGLPGDGGGDDGDDDGDD
jgi:mannose-6-phosphate isomerase-like protein (cupin superfamily)